MNLLTPPIAETAGIIGTCINCTTSSSLLATMIVIALAGGLALRLGRFKSKRLLARK